MATEAVLLWRERARLRVWPGRSDAQRIVASAPSRARVGDCFLRASCHRDREDDAMEVVYPCCCGLDVHKASITACVLWAERGGRSRTEKRRFGTFTRDLLALADWLSGCGVSHVAMEATGVYWKPVWNVLDGHFTEVLLVNAQHIKAVPGRKTDQKDAEWIADLLQHGLL